jgi:hypothetical protein
MDHDNHLDNRVAANRMVSLRDLRKFLDEHLIVVFILNRLAFQRSDYHHRTESVIDYVEPAVNLIEMPFV